MAAARQILLAYAGNLIEYSSDESDSGSENEELLPRIPFVINEIPERALFQRTRLDRRVFRYVLEVISPQLVKNTRKGRYEHLTPMHKLYVALQFYASGSLQWLVGSSARISQSAVSNAIREVTNALVAVSAQFIRFPDADEYNGVKQSFYAFGQTKHGTGFPNVLGAIDCTHVRLQAPSQNPEQYFDRLLQHSINVQLIVGPDLQIYNVFAEYPGSNHDSFIWSNSSVREGLAEGNFTEGWLVGDSGYPQEPWLMTPFPNPTTPAEHLYNSVHISTRNVVERTNGVFKSRWHVLNTPLAYTPRKVCAFTVACSVLHNICTKYNLEVEHLDLHPQPENLQYQGPVNENGKRIRRDLITRHFTR